MHHKNGDFRLSKLTVGVSRSSQPSEDVSNRKRKWAFLLQHVALQNISIGVGLLLASLWGHGIITGNMSLIDYLMDRNETLTSVHWLCEVWRILKTPQSYKLQL